MGRFRIILPLSAVIACALVSCSSGKNVGAVEKPAPAPEIGKARSAGLLHPPEHAADDVGRFLAGLPGRDGSPFRDLESDPAWTAHAKRFDELWSSFDRSRLPAMRDFERKELTGPPIDGALLFYPFGGPDALTALAFFPDRSDYVLAALEPPGTVPGFHRFQKETLAEQLPRFGDTLESLLTKSFFVTREMDRQLRGQVTDGLVPLLLVQLVRMHNRILSYGYIGLDAQGAMIPRAEDERRAAFGGNRGVAIEFQPEGGDRSRTLFYISVNLEDKYLKTNPAFLKYVAALKRPVTMLKSTSYMVHREEFSVIRDAMLATSGAIIQDDSGVPYRFFDPQTWQVQLYGEYEQPYGSFKWLLQNDLQRAYHDPGVKPLTLRIGYGFSKVESNLLVARRKN